MFLTDHVCFVVVELILTGRKAPVDRNALKATDARSWGVLSQKDETNSYYELGRKSSQCTLEFLDSLYQSFFVDILGFGLWSQKKGTRMGEAVFSKQRVLDSVLHLS